MAKSEIFDVLIIGGGPAGLSAALSFARLVHTTVIFDSGVYRNALSNHMHTVPTWDHRDPAEFRAAIRKDLLSRYPATQFQDVKVESISKTDDGLFKATDAKGDEWLGRKVILATGVKDVFPPIDGFADCWVSGIFHCLFCHGYETRGAPSAGVLAVGPLANPMQTMRFSRMATQLAGTVTIYTNGAEPVAAKMTESSSKNSKISVDNRKIKKLVKGPHASDVIVQFEDGTEKLEGFLVHTPKPELNGPFAKQLGIEINDMGDYKLFGMFHETSVHGVFACGDCSVWMKAISKALDTGAVAAIGAISQLEAEMES